jgi:GDSL-like Lipase/Acylhydrolase family
VSFLDPPDPSRGWRGIAVEGRPARRMAIYGDCSWRAMEAAHGTHTPPGYPRVMAERLASEGSGLEVGFGIFGWYEGLPQTEQDLTRYLKLGGDPDLVVVQLGAIYGLRRVLSDNNRLDRLRGAVARALGPIAIPISRLMRPVGQRVGTPVRDYPGTAALESFLALARETWPGACVVLMAPFPRRIASPQVRAMETRVHDEQLAAARRAGVEFVDCAPALLASDERTTGANGYNLNATGSRIVAEQLLALLPHSSFAA